MKTIRDEKQIGYFEHSEFYYKKNKPDVAINVALEHDNVTFDGGDKYSTNYMIVKTSSKLSLTNLKQWAFKNLEQRCYCEHDCCGHWFTTSINVKRLKNRKFSIITGYAQNY